MKFDTPATTNPIDRLKIVGQPLDRIEGPLKTTGTAPYAYERHDVAPNQAYGHVLGSAIAKGRIAAMDIAAARAAPGVLAVVTAETAGKLGKGEYNTATLLGGPEIEHYHQAVALVVAETFEQARHAAELIEVERRVAAEKAAESGKPAEIVAKMVEGSVQKFLKEVSLLNQSFVKNDKQTVEQMLKDKDTKVAGFTLYVVGEGIEKKVDDFAAEVAAQVAAAKG